MSTASENRALACPRTAPGVCPPPLAPRRAADRGGGAPAALEVRAAARDRPMGVGAINRLPAMDHCKPAVHAAERLPSVLALPAGELLRGGGGWPALPDAVGMWP
jgi:hypothetical protein